ncbi:MAG: hypothetical protein L6E13_02805 [Firmicutes bacterium]|nr:hypothetical protein [Bacillota bacterium]
MTPRHKELRNRLEALVDRWMTASPSERFQIVLEKIRLEEAMEEEAQAEERKEAARR